MSNMRQIARLAGVSLAAVSMALRDHPDISLPTREKVKEIARKLNYVTPNLRTSGFTTGKVIGYLIHTWFGTIATDILRGAMEEARQYKFGMTMMQVLPSEDWIEEGINNLLDMGISGLVIAHAYPKLLPKRILLTLRSRGINVVQIMNKVFSEPLDSVCQNEAEYARVAAEHFAALGDHRLLGFALSSPEIWDEMCKSHNLKIDFIHAASGADEVEHAFHTFLQMHPRPTAIIASMDHDAFRVYKLALQYGIAIPRELSILGMGYMYGELIYPEITTIDLQSQEMGRMGIRLLNERMAAGIPPHEITDFRDIILPATIIERGSTGWR